MLCVQWRSATLSQRLALTERARVFQGPVCYRFQYVDGLCGTIILLNGVVGDISVAVQPSEPDAKPISTLMWLRPREVRLIPFEFNLNSVF